MKVILLAGGLGTRLSEHTRTIPKPMVPIGGKPILLHIMKIYAKYGFRDFYIALGYKSDLIKQYYYDEKQWEIVFVDTGEETLKGGRIKRVERYINSDIFHLTYGDGVSDVDLNKLVNFHKSHDCVGTVTAVRPPSRFGELNIDENDTVLDLEEKPQMARGFINGGFFIFNIKMLSHLTEDDDCDFEFGPLQKIARDGQLKAYKHDGFWQCMDNVRERDYLDQKIKDNDAPWIVWE